MKRNPTAGLFLLEDGDIICRECWSPGDDLEKELLVGDTYANDPCDRCGMPADDTTDAKGE